MSKGKTGRSGARKGRNAKVSSRSAKRKARSDVLTTRSIWYTSFPCPVCQKRVVVPIETTKGDEAIYCGGAKCEMDTQSTVKSTVKSVQKKEVSERVMVECEQKKEVSERVMCSPWFIALLGGLMLTGAGLVGLLMTSKRWRPK